MIQPVKFEYTKSNENFEPTTSIECGNKFGRGIEFREGGPIQLLKYEKEPENGKFGQIIINPEALNILQTIREPIAIISVVGSFRRGKSWFANVLHGRHDGFNIGSEVGGCTRGIYMWSPPFKLSHEQSDGETIQKRVIVLDSEGLDDPKQDQNWATKLFILCLTISSTFIYNINGVVEPKDGDFLPRLIILLRDFFYKSSENSKDYFLNHMKSINIEVAAAICKFFYDHDVYCLSSPGCSKKLLRHMEDVETDVLDEEFVEEVEKAVKSIYSQLPLKYIGSSTMQGITFVKFLENIVERMNCSETSITLSIPSEYESVIQFVAQVAIKEAIELYEVRMNTLINEEGKLPILWEEFEEIHIEHMSGVDKLFFEKIIGSPKQINNFVIQLCEKICEFKEKIKRTNSKELMIYNENIAKKNWKKYIENKKNSFKNSEEFQCALKSFELVYDKSMKKSPEANKVITSYKQNQYPAVMDHMTRLGVLDKRLAKAMHVREEADI